MIIRKLFLVTYFWTRLIIERVSAIPVSSQNQDSCDEKLIKVWPTINALPADVKPFGSSNKRTTYRLIKMNWSANKLDSQDIVALFESDPTKSNVKAIYSARAYQTEGQVLTNVIYGRPNVSTLSKGGCVGPWVAFFRKTKVVASKCIMAEPKWMWDNKEILGNKPLKSLVIPGTHNSGTYEIGEPTPLFNPISWWAACQDEPVLNQLLYGIRYFDLRVGYYPNTRELLWMNHDTFQWIPLENILNDVRAFSQISPDPIILDIHRTPVGFVDDTAPRLLVSLINKTLGRYLAPSTMGRNLTPRDMWMTGKTVLVSYGTYALRQNVPWLWPDIFQAWADTDSTDELKVYLDKEMKKSRTNLWVAMGHLTPTKWDYVTKLYIGLRGMADNTGNYIGKWLKERWGDTASIITSDFFHTNTIIQDAIRLNILRNGCPSSPVSPANINIKPIRPTEP